jgi:Protein of unknown function (DUF2911)
MVRNLVRFLCLASACALAAAPAAAQFPGITTPPSGDNQYASVTQGIGPVRLTVEYSSPDVHGPDGADRRGKIWGELVPYGMANLGFGTCGDQCPWRGGANENTVFTTNYDVKVQGRRLPAGSYGLHFLPGKDEWTVIFSKNHTAWGSFFYDPKEDALRVQAKPAKSDYHEWLTYEFTDRQADHATLALQWEDLQLPLTIAVDNIADLYVDKISHELRSSPGFTWQNWMAAAQYTLASKSHLEQGLKWAETAAHLPGTGQENFDTLSTLADLQAANGKADEAKKTMDLALSHPTAGPFQIHLYARRLQQEKKNEEAMKVFELNAKRFPTQWPTRFGLARGHFALGHRDKALAEAELALKQAPDAAARGNVEGFIKQIKAKP